MQSPDAPVGLIALAVGVGASAWILVGAVRRYALFRGVIDHPQARGSHNVATPRGGGLGLVIAALGGFLVALPTHAFDWRIALALLAVAPTAIAGWIDDHGSLSVAPRMAAHAASGALVVPLALSSEWSAAALALGSVWLIATICAVNVVNFIDGIDGLIGLQAIVFGAHLALLGDPGSPGAVLGLTLAAASAGFLMWNWSPARIFLGDVGSGAIGVLGIVGGVLVWRESSWPFLAVFLPLLPIFLDAAATLVTRARRGERLTQPHRSHLYQRLANEVRWGHARVSLLYGIVAASASLTILTVPASWMFWACAVYAAVVASVGGYLSRKARIGPGRVAV